MTHFPEGNSGIRVLDNGGEAIRIKLGDKGWFLLVGGGPDLGFVGDGEFLEKDSYLPWVWAR